MYNAPKARDRTGGSAKGAVKKQQRAVQAPGRFTDEPAAGNSLGAWEGKNVLQNWK